ncbi:hypothetical protein A8C56_23585 [Niabella ginsenosidivorans]|uniref:FecR protein domain-containing protein n=1 Tax=Niabella ginsenosidivorans TaxID=1176587 RepID=A0A1A9I7A1_9BACT|nr:FecR family protein [Niabella ginsenosidivorans]ANH83557.1 hypothetical protein A8C56_23585 [Niabella ginsenosidivorans]
MAEEMDPYLIRKFLNNESTPKEAEAVSAFFEAHPEELDQYFAIEEWQDALKEVELTNERKQAIKKIIDKKAGINRSVLKLPLFRYAAVAVLLLAVAITVVYVVIPRPETGRYERFVINNPTLANKDTVLPDGSRVMLLPGARLSYQSDFLKKRWVTVEEGTVQFEERKMNVPFTAFAQGIATTPIGTKFSVNSAPAMETVEIILLEGKVKVNTVNTVKKMNEVVMAPGDRLFIRVRTMSVILTGVGKQQKAAPLLKSVLSPAKEAPPADAVWTNNAITFSQTALPVVFDKIMDKYNVPIVYDKEQLSRYHFTGAVYYNDDINKLLKNICDVNGLMYNYRNDSIIITRSSEPNP